MVCIVDRLQKTLNRRISSEQIWKHLKTMYNLKALDDSEPLPFPNLEENFDLPLELQTKLKKRSDESEDGETSSVKDKNVVEKKSNSVSHLLKGSSSEKNEKKSQKTSESDQRVHSKRTRGSIHHDADGSSPQTKRRRI